MSEHRATVTTINSHDFRVKPGAKVKLSKSMSSFWRSTSAG